MSAFLPPALRPQTSPWLWVSVGCGGLAMLCFAALFSLWALGMRAGGRSRAAIQTAVPRTYVNVRESLPADEQARFVAFRLDYPARFVARPRTSLRDLYRTLDDPGENPLHTAHAKLDAAVRAAYAMPAGADTRAFLLALNAELDAAERAGHPVTPPELPPAVAPDGAARAAFVTTDVVGVR